MTKSEHLKSLLVALSEGKQIQKSSLSLKNSWFNISFKDALHNIAKAPDGLLLRIAPTISINNIEVPSPVFSTPEMDEEIWIVNLVGGVECCYWANTYYQKVCLQRGLIHKYRLSAETHIMALLSFTRQK